MSVYDDTRCALGEGPLWHPGREEFFWFDIKGRRLHSKARTWQFDEFVSAAGWIDNERMIVASASALLLFELSTGAQEVLCPLEADRPGNRSNDGRADPVGGFWIGTMPDGEDKATGAIYRYYRGELRKLYDPITIPNAISFSPDGGWAFFADTPQQKIWRVALGGEGWPKGEPEVFVDLGPEGLNPDGAVIDAEGHLWNAQYGAGRVARYDAVDGRFLDAVEFDATQTTCPAFGGPELRTLFCTSAAKGLDNPESAHHGMTFAVETEHRGQAEHRVLL